MEPISRYFMETSSHFLADYTVLSVLPEWLVVYDTECHAACQGVHWSASCCRRASPRPRAPDSFRNPRITTKALK
jgi:hypothetical protein